jgi:hypothetical protein
MSVFVTVSYLPTLSWGSAFFVSPFHVFSIVNVIAYAYRESIRIIRNLVFIARCDEGGSLLIVRSGGEGFCLLTPDSWSLAHVPLLDLRKRNGCIAV